VNEPDTGDRIIGTQEAADLLGISRRTVQRMVAEWVRTDTAPIQISTVGTRGEYVFHVSDIAAIKAAKTS
jgi:predicted DNA-binding transcriptional regulator AlpA